MISLIRRKALQRRWKALPPPATIPLTLFSSSTLQQQQPSNPDTVEFLRSSCGLSLESALSAAKKLEIQTLEHPNSVLQCLTSNGVTPLDIKTAVTRRPGILACDVDTNIQVLMSLGIVGAHLSRIIRREPCVLMVDVKGFIDFFKTHGFSKEQITSLSKKRPTLYQLNPTRNFQPKLEYFKGLGLSSTDVAAMLSSKPSTLERSLEGNIKPSVELLRRVFGSDAKMLVVLKGFRVLDAKFDQLLETNISIFLSHGVPESSLLRLFNLQQSPLLITSDRLREVAVQVEKMGFHPKQYMFVLAIRTLGSMHKSRWNRKLELYKSFGLSEDHVLHAFRKQPLFMIVSEDKISKSMDFFINKLKMTPLAVANSPNLLLLSLEKRVVPRCSVLQLLLMKGHFKEKMNLIILFLQTEKKFVERFVSKYKDEIPGVVNAHQGKVEFRGFSTQKEA